MKHSRPMRSAGILVLAAVLNAAGCATSARHDAAPAVSPEAADRIGSLRARFLDPDGPVMVVAHRACWKETAENSIASIRTCRELGVDMVELDVQRTRDGHLVLMHDETVDRTTNGRGRVADLTLAEVRALRLRAGAGGPGALVTKEAPPTFAEAMEAARGALLVNVDAKGDVNLQAVRELERMGLIDHALIKSGDPLDPPLRRMAEAGEILFMPIVREIGGLLLAEAAGRYDPTPPAFEVTFLTAAWFQAGAPAILARNARLWVNTLEPRHAAGSIDADALRDPDAHWGRLIGWGVDMIQTDEPEALIDYLAQCGCGGAR